MTSKQHFQQLATDLEPFAEHNENVTRLLDDFHRLLVTMGRDATMLLGIIVDNPRIADDDRSSLLDLWRERFPSQSTDMEDLKLAIEQAKIAAGMLAYQLKRSSALAQQIADQDRGDGSA